MNTDIIAGSVLLLTGVILTGVFASRELRYRRIVRTGQSTQGTCARSSASHSGTGGVVHFNDQHGRYHRLVFPLSVPAVNDAKVTVIYDPTAPHDAVVSEARFNHLAWLLPALVALAAGGNWMVQGIIRAGAG
jgi:hypothetical protein